jgi:hypothetical protein
MSSPQFFITFAAAAHLDGKHCVFGRVVSGFKALDAMEVSPRHSSTRMRKIRLHLSFVQPFAFRVAFPFFKMTPLFQKSPHFQNDTVPIF